MNLEKMKYRIGVDLGGTYIKAGILDENLQVLAKSMIETKADKPWQEIVERMAYVIKQVQKEAGLRNSAEATGFCVGVGCPGTIDSQNGMVLYSNNIVWENIPLAKELSKHTGCNIEIANDADCAAMGEFHVGAGRGSQSMILITLGTGVGSGVILNGSLITGTELGHMLLHKGGKACTCGREGCLEAYTSSGALVETMTCYMQENMEKIDISKYCSRNLTAKDIFKAARSGDDMALHAVNQYVDDLADGLADIINAYWPDKILLGGGISESADLLLTQLNEKVPERVFGKSRYKKCEIVAASLGNDAGWIGAACL